MEENRKCLECNTQAPIYNALFYKPPNLLVEWLDRCLHYEDVCNHCLEGSRGVCPICDRRIFGYYDSCAICDCDSPLSECPDCGRMVCEVCLQDDVEHPDCPLPADDDNDSSDDDDDDDDTQFMEVAAEGPIDSETDEE